MRWPPESWPWPASVSLLVGSVFVFMASALVSVFIGSTLHLYTIPLDAPSNAPFLLTVQIVTYLPLLAVIVGFLPMVARLPLREIGFRIPTSRDLVVGIGGAVAMFLVVLVAGQLVGLAGYKSPEQSVEVLKHLTTVRDRALFVAVACVFAPIAEELFFRAFLFSAFRRYLPTAGAAIASGICFGLLHMAPSGPADVVPQLFAVAVPLVCGGIVLAYVYVTSGCYWSSVIAHAAFNTVSVVALLVFHQT